MISFIENYSLKNIKKKLLILYLLNVADMICTLLLLNTGFYIEANILMVKVIESPITSFALKIILPAALFYFLYIRMKKATTSQLKKSNSIINFATLLYCLINVSHLVCFAILHFFILN